jgi:protein MpaA
MINMMKIFGLSLLFILSSCSYFNEIKDESIAFFKEEPKDAKKEEKSETPEVALVKKAEVVEPAPVVTKIEPKKSPSIVEKKKPGITYKVKKHCGGIQYRFKKYKWGKSQCKDIPWNHVRNSVLGRPLIWTVFGSEEEHKKTPKNVTLIMCGVHGDEITPVKFCFDIIHDLRNNPDLYSSDDLVVVAPLVNPDSFFRKRPTRTNARGVDINRNFPTKDWWKKAIRQWKKKYKAAKRRNPGKKPLSEPEVLFQVNLIKRYNPNKVISVHAPLTILDYDGPSNRDKQGNNQTAFFANQLLIQMSERAKGYRVSNYPYFPGSLGNYSGNERSIPTYTLELPSSDWTKTDTFWRKFRSAIHHAIKEDLRYDEKKKAAQVD